MAEFGIAVPGSEQRDAACRKHDQWEGDEQDPETEVQARREPVDDALRGVGGFVLQGLQAAHDEGAHEESGGEDEQQLGGGDGRFDGLHE